jgi:hypothetical protein
MSALAAISASAAASAAAASPVFLGAGFVHVNRAPAELSPVELGNRPFRLAIVAHLDESESPRLSGIAIGDKVHAFHAAVCRKQRPNLILGGPKTEIPYKYILHFPFLGGAAIGTTDLEQTALPFPRGSGLLRRSMEMDSLHGREVYQKRHVR